MEKETGITAETRSPQDKKGSEQTESRDEALLKAEREMKVKEDRIHEEKKPEEEPVIIAGKEKIEIKEKTEEKRGILDRLRGKKELVLKVKWRQRRE